MKKNGRFYMNYEATSTAMAVIENLATVEDILSQGHFSKVPNEQKFSEKEAFILQSLHDAAIDLIVPEVKILRNSYIARCSAKKPSENSMKFELR